MAVRVTLDRSKEIMASLAVLTRDKVMVGIPAENAARPGERINNAQIGYIHENGAPEVNIPPRPTLMPGVRNAQEAIINRLRNGALGVLAGREGAADRGLHLAGQEAVNGVLAVFDAQAFTPLSPVTLERRKTRENRPHQGETILEDTGNFRRAYTYVIRKA
jgi:hypothetical protein